MDQFLFDSRQHYWDHVARHYDGSVYQLGGAVPQMIERLGWAVSGCEAVLEVGAGTGLVTRALARSARQVVATDYAREMVEVLHDRVAREGLRNVKPHQIDLYALPGDLGSFDAVVAANVLHLVEDLPLAIAALGRALKPGGRLLVPTSCYAESLAARALGQLMALGDLPLRQHLTTAALADAVATAGMRITHVETLAGVVPIGYVAAIKPLRA